MEPNQNIPSERKVIIDFSKIPKQPPIEWSTGAWNGPLIELDPNDPFGHMESLFSSGVHITSIVPPESGWPIVAHCDLCKKTVVVLSPWAVKPENDDYWKMNGTCLDEEMGMKHNMYPQKWYPWGDGEIKFQVNYPLPAPYFPSMAMFTQHMPIEVAKKRWPNETIPGEENGSSAVERSDREDTDASSVRTQA
jgi:hypothetical protein